MEELHEPHVLLVEDEPIVRLSWKEELMEAGYLVTGVNFAELANRVLQSSKISVVITDIGLPGMDGCTFAGLCRASFPKVPILIVTGFNALPYRHLESDPQICVLQKPIDISVLVSRLRKLLSNQRAPDFQIDRTDFF